MDTQLTELIGRNRLVDELLRAGLEVAIPERDRGIDLIAFVDVNRHTTSFVARPIQLKAASKEQFCIDQKYSRVPGLILAFVWHVHDPRRTVTYALTYSETLSIGHAMGWTKTRSWKHGKYTTQKPSQKLIGLLQRYRMTSMRWRRKVMGGRKGGVGMR
jgi:hypothetical protein